MNSSILLKPRIEGVASDLRYRWSPESGLSCTDCLEPTYYGYVEAEKTIGISYHQGLCRESAMTRIRIANINHGDGIYIPTAFSPNGMGDPENETFKVYGQYIRTIRLAIYNRVGELIYASKDIDKGWDGTYKGEPALMGVYTYYIHYTTLDMRSFERKGSVTLIR